MKVASENMRGRSFPSIAGNRKWRSIADDMRSKKIGVMSLQETHLSDEHVDDIHKFHKHIKIFNSKLPNNPTGAGGVALVFNKLLMNTDSIKIHELVPGRALLATWLWHRQDKMTVLAVYAPTTRAENEDFWRKVKFEVQQHRSHFPKPDIMLGDFNMVEDSIDRFPARMRDIDSPGSFSELKRYLKLSDGWRETFPGTIDWTWRNAARSSMSRIDRIYLTRPMLTASRCWEMYLSGLNANDHSRVSVEIANLDAPKIGKGRWAMSAACASDARFLRQASELAAKAREKMDEVHRSMRTDTNNVQKVWADLKEELRKAAKKRDSALRSKKEASLRDLERRRDEAVDRARTAQDSPAREHARRDLKEVETQIQHAQEKRLQDTFTKRDAKNWAEAETMKKSWFQWTRESKPRDTLASLAKPGTDPTVYVTDSQSMANMAGEYHDRIQTADMDLPAEEWRQSCDEVIGYVPTRMDAAGKREASAQINRENIMESLDSAKSGRAAGLDGLVYELWKAMNKKFESGGRPGERWTDIIGMMLEVFIDVEEHGVVESTGFTDGWMCPLYKKGERTNIANYRPITLLNTDYKIYTKALALKLARSAPRLIHHTQAGFVRGRSITDLAKITSLILNYAETFEENGMIVALDQEKAYDKIRHDYLLRTLEAFGVPDRLVNAVRNLYEHATTRVMVNGCLSAPFRVVRGVRQGDPLSCLIFNLAIEPLAAMLRSSELRGYEIEGLQEKLIATLYADDTTVYLSEHDSYELLTGILTKWCRASGARFNIQKTEIIPLGTPDYRENLWSTRRFGVDDEELPAGTRIARDGEPTRILGTWPGNGVTVAAAWTKILDKVRDRLEKWSGHYPSLNGKAILARVIAGGHTQYLTAAQGMPQSIERELDAAVMNFMWDGAKRPPVNKKTLRRHRDEGGLELFCAADRNDAQYLTWLSLYMAPQDSRPLWAFIADPIFRAATIEPDKRKVPTDQRLNTFYQEWRPNLRKLPFILRQMVRVARKYQLTLEAPLIPSHIKEKVLVWSHPAMLETEFASRAPWTLRCLKLKHEVVTVEDLEEIAELDEDEHEDNSDCECENCSQDREAGCRHPHRCQQVAAEILGSIAEKWNPATAQLDVPTELWRGFEDKRSSALKEGESIVFDRAATEPGRMEDLPRVFVHSVGLDPATAKEVMQREAGQRQPVNPSGRTVHAIVCAGMTMDGTANAKGGFAIAFPDGEYQDQDRRCSGDEQTYMQALAMAIVRTVATVDTGDELHLIVTSRTLVQYLTIDLAKHERAGWLDVSEARQELRAAVAALRSRVGETAFYHVGKKQRKEWPAVKETQERATANAQFEVAVEARIGDFDAFDVPGLSLCGIRQREATRAIRHTETVKMAPRRVTERNITRIKSELEEHCGSAPTTAQIWRGVRHKDMSRNVRNFLWKAIHGAHKIGEYFLKMPAPWKDKATCPSCGVTEDMEHILLDCPDSRQEVIWKLVGDFFERRCLNAGVSYGTILGCANVQLLGPIAGRDVGLERAYRIVVSESAFLIWKIRCIKRIEHEDDPDWMMPTDEATSRWKQMMESRERHDKHLANSIWRYPRASGQAWLAWSTWRDLSKPNSRSFVTALDELGVLVGRDGRFSATGVG